MKDEYEFNHRHHLVLETGDQKKAGERSVNACISGFAWSFRSH